MLLPFLYPAGAIFIFAALIEATCYNPDRTVASNAVPCSSNSTTFCCGTGAICLSTGYCLSATTQPFTLYRGSCTDSGWGSFCAYYCVNYQTGSNAPMVSVGLNDNSRAIYCCGYQSENSNATRCSNGDAPFVLDDGEMIFGRAALANGTGTACRSDPSTTGTTNTAGGTEETPIFTGTTKGTGETGGSPLHNYSTAVGVGVGVPLGVLLLCAVAWGLTKRRRNRRRQLTMTETAQPPMTEAAQESREVYMPPRRKYGPTELSPSTDTNSDTLIHGSPLAEIMGSEARRD
ncbi:uncharacterized protein N7498_004633 [Penicillium cinerascens]|uniref:Mid2 domain-containing protein n=1 Tax=Penicillium cinerascens TaxID=70096 RepID=A0A9W9MM37_9EURO|nr:uncharacterized protein N7498_004633 [Penicillium cinerascens]KAJ5203754.1 hypothetical protein N7498_004633 [Penicillium cinerascens]